MVSVEAWKEKGNFSNLNGYDVFHIENGINHSETIVLIHGFPTSSWDWAPIWEKLSKEYHVIAMDLLGFGFSEKPYRHSYTIVEQADIVEEVVRHFELGSFHVLAHDYGDTVAQELLARQNLDTGVGKWKSCCFLNGGLFPEQHRPLLIQKLLLSPLGPIINKFQSKQKLQASFNTIFGPNTQPSEFEIDSYWKLMNYNNGLSAFPELIHYINDRKTHRDRWFEALKDAEIPLALINGSMDPISGKHMIEHYIEHVGNPVFLAQLDEIGHCPQVEAPEEVLKHYFSFLKI